MERRSRFQSEPYFRRDIMRFNPRPNNNISKNTNVRRFRRERSRTPPPMKLSDRFMRLERKFTEQNNLGQLSGGLQSFESSTFIKSNYDRMMREAKEISIVIERPNLGSSSYLHEKYAIHLDFRPERDYLELHLTNPHPQLLNYLFQSSEFQIYRHDQVDSQILLLKEERNCKQPISSSRSASYWSSRHQQKVSVQRHLTVLPNYERRLKAYILERKKDPALPNFSTRQDKNRPPVDLLNPAEVPRNPAYFEHDIRGSGSGQHHHQSSAGRTDSGNLRFALSGREERHSFRSRSNPRFRRPDRRYSPISYRKAESNDKWEHDKFDPITVASSISAVNMPDSHLKIEMRV